MVDVRLVTRSWRTSLGVLLSLHHCAEAGKTNNAARRKARRPAMARRPLLLAAMGGRLQVGWDAGAASCAATGLDNDLRYVFWVGSRCIGEMIRPSQRGRRVAAQRSGSELPNAESAAASSRPSSEAALLVTKRATTSATGGRLKEWARVNACAALQCCRHQVRSRERGSETRTSPLP